MTNVMSGAAYLAHSFGKLVSKATAALPATTSTGLFTVGTGGRVLLTSVVGEVTTIIQTQANNTKLVFNPTDAGASVDICAALDITADAVGTMYSITGTPATAMQDSLNLVTADKMLARPMILKPGVIELNCAATNTGSVKWSVTYVPLDELAAITAV